MANPALPLLLGGVGGVGVKWVLDLWTGRLNFQRQDRTVLKDERRRAFTDLLAAVDDLTDSKMYAIRFDGERVAAAAAGDQDEVASATLRVNDQFHVHQEVEQRVNRALASIALLGNQDVSDTGGVLVGHAELDFEDPRRVAAMEAYVNACRKDLGVQGPPWRYTHDTLLLDVTVVVDDSKP